jgi:glycosyltransferase involved in cell wall biosynthesis
MARLENNKIIVATHVYADGPAQALRDYLINNKGTKVLFIGHPLFFSPILKGSGYELYEKGRIAKVTYQQIKRLPEIIAYFKAVILNIIWAIRLGKKWDLYVGSNNLNAFSGVILRWLGIVDKTVYYVIDYTPKRFNNSILNRIYHYLDRFCVKNCDETWNLSARMEEARKEYFGFSDSKQRVVPMGVWSERVNQLVSKEIEKHALVFMGHILEKQGIQYVLEAIPDILKEIPDFKFLVIGAGDYLESLKEQAKRLDIFDRVKFTGYIKKHEDIEAVLAKCGVAILMYKKYLSNTDLSWSHFTDSGKIKSYLACGLPVILNDVPPNAGELQKRECGVVVNGNKTAIAQAVISLMKDEQKLMRYRQNALNYSREFDWNLIFKNNLERIISP